MRQPDQDESTIETILLVIVGAVVILALAAMPLVFILLVFGWSP